MESLIFIGDTFQIVGGIMVAYMVIRVHHRVSLEHKIDGKVFVAMRRERVIGFIAIGFMVVGYLIQLSIQVL